MTDRDMEYYARRARQERDNAARSRDAEARRAHQVMAEHYAARLSALEPRVQDRLQLR